MAEYHILQYKNYEPGILKMYYAKYSIYVIGNDILKDYYYNFISNINLSELVLPEKLNNGLSKKNINDRVSDYFSAQEFLILYPKIYNEVEITNSTSNKIKNLYDNHGTKIFNNFEYNLIKGIDVQITNLYKINPKKYLLCDINPLENIYISNGMIPILLCDLKFYSISYEYILNQSNYNVKFNTCHWNDETIENYIFEEEIFIDNNNNEKKMLIIYKGKHIISICMPDSNKKNIDQYLLIKDLKSFNAKFLDIREAYHRHTKNKNIIGDLYLNLQS